MTQEQKAKAYDEALEKAKIEINTKGIGEAVNLCYQLFPQLAENDDEESEDERIRKWLYDLVDEGAYLCERPFATESILAYLEKQKEQKTPMSNDLDKEIERFFDECIEAHDAKIYGVNERVITVDCYELTARHFAEWGEKQKEQNQVESEGPHYTKRNALFDKCVENCDPDVMKKVSNEVDEMLQKEHEPIGTDFRAAVKNLMNLHKIKNEFTEEDYDFHAKELLELVEQKEQKLNYCLYGGYPNVGRCRWCSAACSARLADVHTDEEKEYIRTIKSIISDFIRDKKPENLAYYQRIYDWIDGRHVPFSCGHENGQSAEWAELQSEFKNINEAFEDGKKEVIDHPDKYGLTKQKPVDFPTTDEEVKEFLETHPEVEVPEKYKTPDFVFSKQEYESHPIISTDTTSAKPAELDGKALLYTADKSYQIGFRDGVASVKPAEWSEEDENALKYIHELLVFGYTEKFMDAQTAHDMRKWVNEHLRPDTFQNGNSHWKPSEEQLPGIEEHGIPGKDFIPVEWVDACEKYGKWKIVQQEQPSLPDNLKLNMTRTKLELNEIETLTHLVRARAVEPGNFQGLYKNILSKLNKMFDEEYAERERKEEK